MYKENKMPQGDSFVAKSGTLYKLQRRNNITLQLIANRIAKSPNSTI